MTADSVAAGNSYTAYDKQYTNESYRFFKNRGICTECHKERAFNGRARCPTCIEKRALYDANRDREYMRRKARERANRLLQAGICRECGKRPIAEGKTRCAECLKTHCLRVKIRNAQKRVRKPEGLCKRRGCENPVVPGMKTCSVHYPEMVMAAARMRAHCDNSNHIWRKITEMEIERIKRGN